MSTVRFEGDSPRSAEVADGTTVLEAARAAGALIPAGCAGRGICGSCAVRVLSGALAPPDEVESATLARAPEGTRLACRARVAGDVTVRALAQTVPATRRASGAADREVVLVAAVDLGTTGGTAAVADAGTGRELARATTLNRQATHGADIASRISAALGGRADELRVLGEESVRAALAEACSAADVPVGRIARVLVVANSAVTALFAGSDVSGLAMHPFENPVGEPLRLGPDAAASLGLSRDAELIVAPGIAGFVGGDALAVFVASGLARRQRDAGVALVVDLGTNAEILLAVGDRLYVASAAAGPAFEGAGVAAGGPALPGAVDAVRWDGTTFSSHVIGDLEPRWLCGTGLISALRALREAGYLDASGLLIEDGPLASRFSRDEHGVLGVDLGAAGRPLRLDQLDVRALQLAKAAVLTGVRSVLTAAGATTADVATVHVAGAFGSALEAEDLRVLGILPMELAAIAVSVGNAALDGALALTIAPGMLEDARAAALRACHVDLAADPGFAAALLKALPFAPAE